MNDAISEIRQILQDEKTADEARNQINDSQSVGSESMTAGRASRSSASQEVEVQHEQASDAQNRRHRLDVIQSEQIQSQPTQATSSQPAQANGTSTLEREGERRVTGVSGRNQVQVGGTQNRQTAASQRKNNKVCRYYRAGDCKFGQKGEGCKYDHPRKCFKYTRYGKEGPRGCKDSKCSYFHPPLCHETEAGRPCRRAKCKYYHRKFAQTKRGQRFERSLERAAPENTRLNVRQSTTRTSILNETPQVAVDMTPGNSSRVLNTQTTSVSERYQEDFRVLKDQLGRLERQIQFLLDVRNGSGRNQGCVCH